MTYRTKTYIAADWDSDEDAVAMLHHWNDSNHWSLHFHDAHTLKQARDSSLYCSIKRSLKERMNASKTFILIVGDNTTSVAKGGCRYCSHYSSYWGKCTRGYSVDHRSYVNFECDKAIEAGINIIVLYKATTVNKNKCPAVLRNVGTHAAMWCRGADGVIRWDYTTVKKAIQ